VIPWVGLTVYLVDYGPNVLLIRK